MCARTAHLARPSERAVGAHAKGHNDKSIGICCEGAYMTETMPAAQLAALKDLIRDIMSRYGKLKLLRHKDVNETDCPGVNFPWAEVQRYADTQQTTKDSVEKEIKAMTDKEFAQYMDRYLAAKANQQPHPYAAEAWAKAKAAGIVDGSKPQCELTREQFDGYSAKARFAQVIISLVFIGHQGLFCHLSQNMTCFLV